MLLHPTTSTAHIWGSPKPSLCPSIEEGWRKCQEVVLQCIDDSSCSTSLWSATPLPTASEGFLLSFGDRWRITLAVPSLDFSLSHSLSSPLFFPGSSSTVLRCQGPETDTLDQVFTQFTSLTSPHDLSLLTGGTSCDYHIWGKIQGSFVGTVRKIPFPDSVFLHGGGNADPYPWHASGLGGIRILVAQWLRLWTSAWKVVSSKPH